MAKIPPFLLIGTAVVCVGVLFHVIGLSTTHWFEVDRYQQHAGLFRSCVYDRCLDIVNPTSKLKSIQAMTVIGMLAGGLGAAIALILVLCRLLSKNTPPILSLLSAAVCFGAFVCIIIGIIIYGTDEAAADVGNVGYSFALCIVGAILIAGGAVLVYLGGKTAQ